MPSPTKWATPGAYTTLIAGAGVAPTLKNLANGTRKLGNAVVDNRERYADFELQCRGASAFSAGGYVALYLIPAIDGTNYTDGDDSTDPPATTWVGNFPLRAVTTQQRVALPRVELPNGDWKPLVINRGGVALTNTDNENILSYLTYNEET